MPNAPRRLGRGLSSLISPQVAPEPEVPPAPKNQQPQTASRLPEVTHAKVEPPIPRAPGAIALAKIRVNPMQPRRDFDEHALATLAKSIADRGTLQPILVRPAENGYELIAGERRFRAAKLAGLTEIPAIVRPVSDEDMLELALIENIHRENLNPIERARAYRTLQDKYGWSHDVIADRMGDDRATVSNYIRILSLEESVQQLIATGDLGVGHAKALLAVGSPKSQVEMAHRAIREGWSVRRMEAFARTARETAEGQNPPPAGRSKREARPAVRDMEQRLRESLGLQVKIEEGRRPHSGRITIEYYSLDDFERVTGRLGVASDTM